MSQTFAKLPADIRSNAPAWQAIFDATEPQCVELPGSYSELSAFDKLLIIRMIRPDKLVPAVRAHAPAAARRRALSCNATQSAAGICAWRGHSTRYAFCMT